MATPIAEDNRLSIFKGVRRILARFDEFQTIKKPTSL